VLDLTITLGDLISAAAPISAVIAAYIKLSDRLRVVEIRVDLMWQHYERRSRTLDRDGER
jgi:hypothetical protein